MTATEKTEKPLSNKQKKKLAEQAKQAAASGAAPAQQAPAAGNNLALWETVTAQGNKIRELKSQKASKDDIMKARVVAEVWCPGR